MEDPTTNERLVDMVTDVFGLDGAATNDGNIGAMTMSDVFVSNTAEVDRIVFH
jgi:hypothetical protein